MLPVSIVLYRVERVHVHVYNYAGLMTSQTSCPDIFQEGGLVYIVTNLTSQVVKLVGQMPNLPGKCPVTDC